MNILIRNADIITLDEQQRLLRQADLAIAGETIVAVGQSPVDFKPDEIVDGYDHVVLPAFYNAHTHAPMTLERGWAEDLPFDRWLNEKIWLAESALTEEDVYWGAALPANLVEGVGERCRGKYGRVSFCAGCIGRCCQAPCRFFVCR